MVNRSKEETVEALFRKILMTLGEMNREGTRETPKRYAKFITGFLKKPEFNFTVFEEPGVTEMVIQNGIPVYSLCEHHTLPFMGTASVAIIPNGKTIVGLSKLARTVAYYAHGFQNQERITNQVGQFLLNHDKLQPIGVGVSLRCTHSCMTIRGAKAHGSVTTTQFLGGAMKTDPAARAEFLQAVEHSGRFYQ